jgi:hypothetical protein
MHGTHKGRKSIL